jgi:hypothetical protein
MNSELFITIDLAPDHPVRKNPLATTWQTLTSEQASTIE